MCVLLYSEKKIQDEEGGGEVMSARLHSGGSPVSHRVTKFPPPPPVWAVYTFACYLLRYAHHHQVGVTAALSCLGIEGRETIQAGVCPQERDNKT